MLENIVTVLAATSTAIFISDLSGIGRRIGYRPFNCAMCLSAWVGAALFFVPQLISNFLFCMFVPGCLGAVISRKWL